MDKNKKLFYTIIGAISALAAATAAFLALKKHRCAEQKLIEEIDDIVSEKEPEEATKEEPTVTISNKDGLKIFEYTFDSSILLKKKQQKQNNK
jgi:phosphate starvation-inducible protein PhoH